MATDPSLSAWQRLARSTASALDKTIKRPVASFFSAEAIVFEETQDERLARAVADNDEPAFTDTLANLLANSHRSLPIEAPKALTYAVEHDNPRFLERLLNAGAAADSVCSFLNERPPRPYSERVIHLAARQASPDALQLLLQNHADANALSAKQRTPLMIACSFRHSRHAELLIQAAPQTLNARDAYHLSALDYSLYQDPRVDPLSPFRDDRFTGSASKLLDRLCSCALIAKRLLEAGARADPRPQDSPRQDSIHHTLPPLAAAIRIRDNELIDQLIQAGAPTGWLFEPYPLSPSSRSAAFDAKISSRFKASPQNIQADWLNTFCQLPEFIDTLSHARLLALQAQQQPLVVAPQCEPLPRRILAHKP